MYSTCLYCTKDLGSNEILETLPVGRRVAFDEAQGRLWVICRACEKWNLVPFDTRLESIDACERIFRATRTRFSTDHIGIARVNEGLELVRIGPALRPEFAAWRYGDQFGRRRKRNMLLAAGGVVAVGGVIVGAATAGVAFGGSYWIYQSALKGIRNKWRQHTVAVRLTRPEGEQPLAMTRADLEDVKLVADAHGWVLGLTDRRVQLNGSVPKGLELPDLFLRGQDAIGVIGKVLPKMSGFAGSRAQVQEAVSVLAREGHPDAIVARHLRAHDGPLKQADPSLRLALEMAAHEESERVALHGELKLLEREWRKAEEMAKIADALALPESVESEFASRKASGRV